MKIRFRVDRVRPETHNSFPKTVVPSVYCSREMALERNTQECLRQAAFSRGKCVFKVTDCVVLSVLYCLWVLRCYSVPPVRLHAPFSVVRRIGFLFTAWNLHGGVDKVEYSYSVFPVDASKKVVKYLTNALFSQD